MIGQSDFARKGSPKRNAKEAKAQAKADEADDSYFEDLEKKVKMPKYSHFSPDTRTKLRGLVSQDLPAAEALKLDHVMDIVNEKLSSDPDTAAINKLTHYDAILQKACSKTLTSSQQVDIEYSATTVEKALDLPAKLTDTTLVSQRIESAFQYVGQYQSVQSCGTYCGLTQAVTRELHAKYAAKVIGQRFANDQITTPELVNDWVAANEAYLRPFSFMDDEDEDNPGELRDALSMYDWLINFLTMHKKTPVNSYGDLEAIIKDYEDGAEGLLESKCRMMKALEPAMKAASTRAKETMTKDRMVMKCAVHADTIPRDENNMPTPSPFKEQAADTPQPAPLGYSPIVQPGGGIRPGNSKDSVMSVPEGSDETDPIMLVQASGTLVVDVYVLQYLRAYNVGMIGYRGTLGLLLSGNELEYAHKIGFQQISNELVPIAKDLQSYKYPGDNTFESFFDLGMYAVQLVFLQGSAKLGLSLEANLIFTEKLRDVELRIETVVRRLNERATKIKDAETKEDKEKQLEKLEAFLPWLEYAAQTKPDQVLAYMPKNAETDEFWKLKIVKQLAQGLLGFIRMLKLHINEKKSGNQIDGDKDASYALKQMQTWCEMNGPENVAFVESMAGHMGVVYANGFDIICKDEKVKLHDLVLGKVAVLTLEVLEKRKKLLAHSEISHLRFMNAAYFVQLEDDFKKFSTG
eukprot:g10987.t1